MRSGCMSSRVAVSCGERLKMCPVPMRVIMMVSAFWFGYFKLLCGKHSFRLLPMYLSTII
jgi:hypothetical protein